MSKEQEKMQQEDFLIDKDQRKKVVRQDRYTCEDRDYLVRINNQEFEVLDFSYFSVSFKTDHDCPLKTKFKDIEFTDGEESFGVYQGFVMRTEQLDDGNFKIAVEFEDQSLPVDSLISQEKVLEILGEHKKYLGSIQSIPQEFRAAVFEVKSTLQHLKEMISQFEESQFFYSEEEKEIFENATSSKIMRYLDDYFTPLYDHLVEFTKRLDEKQLSATYDFFRHELKDILYLSPFAHRSFHKPMGYAGDYEMMNILYRNEAVGPNLFAKGLNQYFVNASYAKAVRNRSHYLKHFLSQTIDELKEKDVIKILCVASGPAREVRLLLEDLSPEISKKIEVNLLDQDLFSLKFAQRENNKFLSTNHHDTKFYYHNMSIKNIIFEGLSDKYDIVYSAGLFDYFTDRVAHKAASQMYKAVNPGGTLNIGNFCLKEASALQMTYALDWN